MHLNHPQTIPHLRSVEKFSSMKLIPGTKKIGTSGLENSKLTFYEIKYLQLYIQILINTIKCVYPHSIFFCFIII